MKLIFHLKFKKLCCIIKTQFNIVMKPNAKSICVWATQIGVMVYLYPNASALFI